MTRCTVCGRPPAEEHCEIIAPTFDLETREGRFWSKIDASGDCWLWTGSRANTGYGTFNGASNAHRYAWQLLVGPIPEGYHLDHLCRNPPCVNPDHLEPVTPRENHSRSPIHHISKKYCKNGHLFSETNTYIRRDTGHRLCKACCRIREARRRAAQQAERVQI
jgi:hypothetical protein